MTACWGCVDSMDVIRVDMDGQTAIFDQNTGNTYVFDILTAEILLKLLENRLDEGRIKQHLIDVFQFDATDSLDDHIATALADLEQSFLVHRLSTC
ncbi:MAG: hypothetical protein OEX19_07930 [Gammaproteobacteria bacterium]|nr:hypothetical protein [Gammaproteobacteria bacterium]